MIQKPIIIIGTGGHAKVLIDTLKSQSANIIGVTNPAPELYGKDIMGIPIIGDDESILQYGINDIVLVNGIGMASNFSRRMEIYDTFKKRGYIISKVIHSSAVISPEACLAEGVQVMAGAIIQALATIGINTIINTKASVDHDCKIGNHCHVAPGATISGGVTIEDNVFVGAGAVIIQGIHIGASCTVGAGTVVTENVMEGTTVVGSPARVVNKTFNN
ncbi:MAG: acetyltransferase [Syntrophomonadaceae bacterium]|jgi:sugar O-acyltransferase (sialic acid O-acetyltransferase NeuD family)